MKGLRDLKDAFSAPGRTPPSVSPELRREVISTPVFFSSVLLSSLELSHTEVYEPSIRALLGTHVSAAEREGDTWNGVRDFDMKDKALTVVSVLVRSARCPRVRGYLPRKKPPPPPP